MNYMGNRGPDRDSKGSEGAEASSAAPPLLGAASCLWALSGGGVQSSLHTLVMGITQNTQAWGCFHHGLLVAVGLGRSSQMYGHACLHTQGLHCLWLSASPITAWRCQSGLSFWSPSPARASSLPPAAMWGRRQMGTPRIGMSFMGHLLCCCLLMASPLV